jgi:hypothetical protein
MESLDMSNLPQTRNEAKQLYLRHQQQKVLKGLENASDGERCAVIRHIDGFLNSTTPEGKIFWLRIREKLERLNEHYAV